MGTPALPSSGAAQALASETAAPEPAARPDPAVGGWTLRSCYTLGFLTLIYAFNTADRNVFGLLMPLMKAEMHLSDTMLGFLSGFAFACFYALAGLPVAYMAERWSRRNIIAAGFFIWSVMTICAGLVRNVAELVLARFLLGAGEAGGLAPSNSMVGDLFDKRRRTVALSILQCANALGILVAFPVIGWAAAHYGWRRAYFAAGIPGLVLALAFLLTVKEPPRGQSDGVDASKLAPKSFISTARRLLTSRGYLFALAASTILGLTLSGLQTWTPTFLMRLHHLGTQEVGAYTGAIRGPAGIIGAVSGGLITSALARSDSRWLVWAPASFMALIGLSDLLLLLSMGEAGWKFGMAAETFFTGAQVGPMFGLLLAATDARSRAMATATAMLALYFIGLTFGPLLVGSLADLFRPAFGDGGLRLAMLTVGASSFLAALTCLAVGRPDADAAEA